MREEGQKGQEGLQVERLNSNENSDCIWTDLFMDAHTKTASSIWFSKE